MKISDSRHRLKELLNECGDTQNEMARKTGLTKSAISNYINGSREPRQDAILKISNTYKVNPAWLMGLDVPKYENKKDENDISIILGNLMEYNSENNEDIAEVKKIMEIATNSDTSKALKMYDMFLNAPAHIQSAVESLLKGSQQES